MKIANHTRSEHDEYSEVLVIALHHTFDGSDLETGRWVAPITSRPTHLELASRI